MSSKDYRFCGANNSDFKYCKIAVSFLLILFIAIIIGALAMISVYALSTQKMFKHAQASVTFYQRTGTTFFWATGLQSSRLDNWTDSYMISHAIYPTKSIVNDAMNNPRYTYKSSFFSKTRSDPVQSLIMYLNKDKTERIVENYSRYWHGYLLLLKPLLLLLPLPFIRLLNMIAQILLVFYFLSLLQDLFGRNYSLSFLLAYIILNPVSLVLSFQHSVMFYLAVFFSILVIKNGIKLFLDKNYLYLFFVAGISTAFFDFLTYPLFSLAIPLIILILVLNKQGCLNQLGITIKLLIASSASWGIGYSGMLIGKWLVSSLLIGKNMIYLAINAAKIRVSTPMLRGKEMTAIDAIKRNFDVVLKEPMLLLLIAGIILLIYLCIKFYKEKRRVSSISTLTGLGIIALYPVVWYSVYVNHSYFHFWFTYRELAISVFAMGCIFSNTYEQLKRE